MSASTDLPPGIARLAAEARLGRPIKLFTARRNMRLFAQDIYVFEYGGVFADSAAETKVIRWEQVAGFYQDVTRYRQQIDQITYHYRFVLHDGTKHKVRSATTFGIGRNSGLETFGPLVDELIARVIVPRLLETIHNGGTVSFNRLHLDADGISDRKGKKRFSWAEVGGIQFVRDAVSVFSSMIVVAIFGRTEGRFDDTKLLLRERASEVCNQVALATIVERLAEAATHRPVEKPPRVPSMADDVRIARADLAQAHGWNFTEADIKAESFGKMVPLFGYPMPDFLHGRLTGRVRDRAFVLFDFPIGDDTYLTWWSVMLPGKVPLVRITATSARSGTGESDFDGAYEVTCDEHDTARRLLTPPVRQRILQLRPTNLILSGRLIMRATTRPKADDIPGGLDDLASIAELIPGTASE